MEKIKQYKQLAMQVDNDMATAVSRAWEMLHPQVPREKADVVRPALRSLADKDTTGLPQSTRMAQQALRALIDAYDTGDAEEARIVRNAYAPVVAYLRNTT